MKTVNPATYTFEELRRFDNIYVDKTEYIYNLITTVPMVFFARPRRFGKSLTVTTLKAIFEGKRELFKGLAIDSKDYDWKIYPVIHISFLKCGDGITAEELDKLLSEIILGYADKYSVSINTSVNKSYVLFYKLIETLAAKGEKVVVLIDEYDKVISDNFDSDNVEKLRTVLSNFYQVLKDQDANIRFAFITGVSKYSKLSIFSKMNNLRDYSMNKYYACMCGYTQAELEHYFADYIEKGLQESGKQRDGYLLSLKVKYDGYKFHHRSESVYNPVSIGCFFDDGGADFRDYWAATGTPTILMDIAQKVNFSLITDLKKSVSDSFLDYFDIVSLGKNPTTTNLKSLLFQTGYLTIKRTNPSGTSYFLDFPNQEVRKSFSLSIIGAYYPSDTDYKAENNDLLDAFSLGNTQAAIEILQSIYAAIPYNLIHKNECETKPKQNEAYYHSIFYAMMLALGANISVEVAVRIGRIDAIIECDKHVYVIEFKVDKTAEVAVEQIDTNQYAKTYEFNPKGKTIHRLGINFNTKEGNIDDFIDQIVQS